MGKSQQRKGKGGELELEDLQDSIIKEGPDAATLQAYNSMVRSYAEVVAVLSEMLEATE